MKKILIAMAFAGVSSVAIAQTTTTTTTQPSSGAATGAVTGAVGGAVVGGPVGAVVGAAGGAIIGGIADAMQPKFRTYVVEQKRADYVWKDGTVAVGSVLPAKGVTYYEVPAEYKVAPEYRYTVVNGKSVLVDPKTHKIVQIIN